MTPQTPGSVACLPEVFSRSLVQRHLEVLEWNARASEQAHVVNGCVDVFGRHVRAVCIPLPEEKQEEEGEAEAEEDDFNGRSEWPWPVWTMETNTNARETAASEGTLEDAAHKATPKPLPTNQHKAPACPPQGLKHKWHRDAAPSTSP